MRANFLVAALVAMACGACTDGAVVAWQIDRARFEALKPDSSPDAALKRAWMAARMNAPSEHQAELAAYRAQAMRDIERAAQAFFDDAGVQQLLIDYKLRAGDTRGAAEVSCRVFEARQTFEGFLSCGDARMAAGQASAATESWRRAFLQGPSRDAKFTALGRIESASPNPAEALRFVEPGVLADYRMDQHNQAVERERQAQLQYQQAQYRAYEDAQRRQMAQQAAFQAQQRNQYQGNGCKADCEADEAMCRRGSMSWIECGNQRRSCDTWCETRYR